MSSWVEVKRASRAPAWRRGGQGAQAACRGAAARTRAARDRDRSRAGSGGWIGRPRSGRSEADRAVRPLTAARRRCARCAGSWSLPGCRFVMAGPCDAGPM